MILIDQSSSTEIGDKSQDAMAGALSIYNRACAALFEAKTIDEVLEIKSRAAAIREYAIQVKNRELEMDAVEIRLRATRRIGQLINAVLADGYLEHNSERKKPLTERHLLLVLAREFGIHYNSATLARRMAAPSDEAYSRLIDDWRQRCRNESKVTARLLPVEPTRSKYQPDPEPVLAPGPLNDYYFSFGERLGDWCANDIVQTIEDLQFDIKLLRAIHKQIGDFDHLGRVLVRDLITDQRVKRIFKNLGCPWKEGSE